MLNLLHERVRRTDIDDAQVIDLVERFVGFVRRPQAAFVLIKEKVLSIGHVGF